MLDFIRTILEEKKSASTVFKRNLVKEYLQLLILSFLYSHKEYRSLVFYGGSCLRHCYDLPRLSEDLDFVDIEKRVNLNKLADDLLNFFKKKHNLKINTKVQKFRCTLKFPILQILGLSEPHETNYLFSKIEVYKEFEFCHEYNIEIKPIFKLGEAFLVKSFDLPTLMATKIRAILYRKWEKKTKNGKVLAEVKGRDYYDLMWYLEKGVKPNMKCIENFPDERSLYEQLIEIVRNVNPQSIKNDLEGLIEEPGLVITLKDNIKEIIISSISRRL